MSGPSPWRRARDDESGAAVIEFAILAPLLFILLIMVLQVGFYMQAQNALRGISGDMSRQMMIEFQKDKQPTNDQIRTIALAMADNTPYMLKTDRLDITVADAATQPIGRVRQIELTVSYDVPNFLGFADVGILSLDLTRSLFVPAPTPTA